MNRMYVSVVISSGKLIIEVLVIWSSGIVFVRFILRVMKKIVIRIGRKCLLFFFFSVLIMMLFCMKL